MGDLEKLSQSYSADEFMLVGVCYDVYDRGGGLNQSQVEKAGSLMNDAGTTFTNLIPTQDMIPFFKSIIPGFPTTFFVGSDGKIIEYTCGAKDLEEWKAKVDEVLEKAE